jgi:hypothetical protein
MSLSAATIIPQIARVSTSQSSSARQVERQSRSERVGIMAEHSCGELGTWRREPTEIGCHLEEALEVTHVLAAGGPECGFVSTAEQPENYLSVPELDVGKSGARSN